MERQLAHFLGLKVLIELGAGPIIPLKIVLCELSQMPLVRMQDVLIRCSF
jgi:hypothetical protein